MNPIEMAALKAEKLLQEEWDSMTEEERGRGPASLFALEFVTTLSKEVINNPSPAQALSFVTFILGAFTFAQKNTKASSV